MVKKKDDFVHCYNQVGGHGASGQLPMNVFQGGKIKQYTINFDQHNNFHDFFDERKYSR